MRFSSLRSWLAGNRRRQVVAGGIAVSLVIAIASAGLAVGGVFSGGGSSTRVLSAASMPTPSATPTPTPSPTPAPTEPTLIDGGLVYKDELLEIQNRLPLAIMFDNFVDARPQTGLNQADLVFEAVAEGGITRFLAVYWRNAPGRVLAVRSARAYYLDWAAELDAIYVHWGAAKSDGPADVASAISRLGLRHFDGFHTSAPYFSRDPDRLGPHDGIGDTDAMWELAASSDWSGPPDIKPWKFKDDQPQRAGGEGASSAPTIDIGFGGPFSSDYSVHWRYDPNSNGYNRSQGGTPHRDGRSGDRIQARNVAVMITSVWSAGDGTSHLLYETTGGGDAVVFQDGVAIPGTWARPDIGSRTRFYDDKGKEIAFNRGQTWIEVLSFGDPLGY